MGSLISEEGKVSCYAARVGAVSSMVARACSEIAFVKAAKGSCLHLI
jgi:hypothetical protein